MNTRRDDRVRIKVCGITRVEDVAAAAHLGADALGFNCYPGSPRFVPPAALTALARAVPAFVTPVLLFVNAPADVVRAAVDAVPHALLQFHGDETEPDCAQFGRPYLRAIRMSDGVRLLDCERSFSSAMALLADAPAPGFGGGGQVFDWARIPAPAERRMDLVLAGGLEATNVAVAIKQVQPAAVDVSSGVEAAKGIKDPARIRSFIAAVRAAERIS
jgi:phosphoribosylanthranilate isomerase